MAEAQHPWNGSLAAKSIRNLVRLKRIPRIAVALDSEVGRPPICPYFRLDPTGAGAWTVVTCPFAPASAEGTSLGVYEACARDPLHRERRARASSEAPRRS